MVWRVVSVARSGGAFAKNARRQRLRPHRSFGIFRRFMIRTAQRPGNRTKRSFRLRTSIFGVLHGSMPTWSLSCKSTHRTSMRRWIKMPRWWRRIKPTRSFRTNIFARISRSTRTGPSMTSCCIRSFATATFRRDLSNCACSKTRSWIGNGRKDAPKYRFLAIREPLRQLELPHIKAPTLPFPTQEFENAGRYKLFSVVTNRLTMPGDALIRWHRERCGMSEKAHAVMKDDLAGGTMPSALFGVNAAWWTIMIIASHEPQHGDEAAGLGSRMARMGHAAHESDPHQSHHAARSGDHARAT